MPKSEFPISNIQFPIKKGFLKKSFCMKRGFSLIELLVVISIIAVLIGVGAASWRNAQQKGRDGQRKTDLKSVQQALETYFSANGKYPDANSGDIQCNLAGDTTIRAWGQPFTCGGTTFMKQLPQDSAYQSTQGYYYSSLATLNYVLSAAIENDNDPDLLSLPCSPQGTRNYCVTNP